VTSVAPRDAWRDALCRCDPAQVTDTVNSKTCVRDCSRLLLDCGAGAHLQGCAASRGGDSAFYRSECAGQELKALWRRAPS
jgi:hypothetical protein